MKKGGSGRGSLGMMGMMGMKDGDRSRCTFVYHKVPTYTSSTYRS